MKRFSALLLSLLLVFLFCIISVASAHNCNGSECMVCALLDSKEDLIYSYVVTSIISAFTIILFAAEKNDKQNGVYLLKLYMRRNN